MYRGGSGLMHRRHASRDHQAARELERAVLFGLVEPPSRSASTVAVLKRVSLIFFIAVLTLLGGPGADAFASTFFVASGRTFYVTNNQDSGPGSLRQAILDADAAAANGAPSTITVAAGVASLTIDPQSPLPGITGIVLLDGRGLITVNNTSAGTRANGLALQPGSGGSEITGVTIIGAKWAAILLDSPGVLIQGNTIGDTTAAGQENRYGIFMVAGNNTIGGAGAGAGNVISGNKAEGVLISGADTRGNLVEGNFIGTDSAGGNTIGNGDAGVLINAGAVNNTIGGAGAGAGNVISGNKAEGVLISGADTRGNLVEGNFIGTDSAGGNTIGNGDAGVLINAGAVNNTIGGTGAGAGNVISGNKAEGVLISGADTRGNLVEGNFIGTDSAGGNTIGNGDAGVLINAGAVNNTIGGTGAGAGNVISGNKAAGVSITGADTAGNAVQGNHIGTNPTGTGALSNQNGVVIQAGAVNNTIGGAVANTIGRTAAGARNVISGNRSAGVAITGAGTRGNVVEGNFIGTNPTGTGALSNQNGVVIQAGAVNNTIGGAVANTIGGTAAGARNVISGNRSAAVTITGAGARGNVVEGNFIGTQAGGKGPLGNGSAGILINRGAKSNTVGGTVPGAGNAIAYNVQAGVRVGGLATAGASILGNSIFANGSAGRGPGIQLTGGANDSELPPTIKSLTTGAAGSMTISGTGKRGSRVEVFEDATCADPEGRQFVAAVVPRADGSWRVSVALLHAGSGVTATETDGSTRDTSRFSRCSLVS